MRTTLRALFLILGATLALWTSGCTQNPPTTGGPSGATSGSPGTTTQTSAATGDIKIGCYFSMTGGTATFGESSMNGIRLAIDEINAKGGVLGRKLSYQLEDTQGAQDKAALAVQKLINQANVDVIIGEVASSSSIAGGNIAQNSGVPMLSPSSTNEKVTKVGNFIFRACFIDPFQGFVMARFAKDNLKAKTAAILTDKQSDYAIGLAKAFRGTFEQDGGKIVGEEFYIQNDTDFKGQLTRLKQLNPDVIFVPGYYTEAGLVAQQARELGFKGPLLGGDGWDSPKLTEVGGEALNDSYFSVHVDVESSVPKVQEFVKAYQAKYSANPDTLAVLGYDSVYLMADALTRAGSTDKAKVRDALASTRGFQGVSGTITMNADRDPVKEAVVVAIKDGKAVFVTSIKPAGGDIGTGGDTAPATTAPSPAPTGAASPGADAASPAASPAADASPAASPADASPAASPADASPAASPAATEAPAASPGTP